jgi:hypothetical protein
VELGAGVEDELEDGGTVGERSFIAVAIWYDGPISRS